MRIGAFGSTATSWGSARSRSPPGGSADRACRAARRRGTRWPSTDKAAGSGEGEGAVRRRDARWDPSRSRALNGVCNAPVPAPTEAHDTSELEIDQKEATMMDRMGGGVIYTQTNEPANEVIAIRRDEHGALDRIGSFATEGAGDAKPHLTSQGSVTLAGDGRHPPVTNAGSDDVTLVPVGAG